MQPLNLNDYWYHQDPVPRCFKILPANIDKFAAWAKPYMTSGGIINVVTNMQNWSEANGLANARGVYYKEISLY